MSTDVIDFESERTRRTGPDAEFVTCDDFGRKLYCFSLEYEMDGAEYGAHIWAYDMDDAMRRVDAMRQSLRYEGQIYRRIPFGGGGS